MLVVLAPNLVFIILKKVLVGVARRAGPVGREPEFILTYNEEPDTGLYMQVKQNNDNGF